jgi:hypothetical protein
MAGNHPAKKNAVDLQGGHPKGRPPTFLIGFLDGMSVEIIAHASNGHLPMLADQLIGQISRRQV